MTKSCSHMEEKMVSLMPETTEEVEFHRQACPQCRETHHQMTELKDLLVQYHEKLDQVIYTPQTASISRDWSWIWYSAAAAVMLVCSVLNYLTWQMMSAAGM